MIRLLALALLLTAHVHADTIASTVLPPTSYTITPLVLTGTFERVLPKAEPEFFNGDTSMTWVVHLEPGGKKLDVWAGGKIYRFRTKGGKINLDTLITESK